MNSEDNKECGIEFDDSELFFCEFREVEFGKQQEQILPPNRLKESEQKNKQFKEELCNDEDTEIDEMIYGRLSQLA